MLKSAMRKGENYCCAEKLMRSDPGSLYGDFWPIFILFTVAQDNDVINHYL